MHCSLTTCAVILLLAAVACPAAAQERPISVRLQLVVVSDDDGGRTARTSAEQMTKWVAFANDVFGPQGIRFVFDPGKDCSGAKSTLVNNITGVQDANWDEARSAGDELAARYPDRMVILSRHGPGEGATGGAFSWTDYNFVAMGGYADSWNCGHPHVDALAHEIGHYLGLSHTFGTRAFSSVPDAEEFLTSRGNDPSAFDGDGLADTAPDPIIAPFLCEHVAAVTLNGREFVLPRRNIMSYYEERDELSGRQGKIARWVLRERMRNRMSLPANRPEGMVIEAETARITARRDCETGTQQMDAWGRGRWSKGAQLFCAAGEEGFVEISLPLQKAGRYSLSAYFTKAPDFPKLDIRLDGRRIRRGVDTYAPIVVPSGEVDLGTFDLDAGPHVLRFNVAGRNSESHGWAFGVDCVSLAEGR